MSPACAGMIPVYAHIVDHIEREPRMRGDDPYIIHSSV